MGSGSAQLKAFNEGQVAISPADQVVVPVLGMHRAGGSLVARLMNLVGMGLGYPLQHPSQENPRGSWEHLLFQSVNMQLLDRYGPGCNQDAFGTPEALVAFARQMGVVKLPEVDHSNIAEQVGFSFMEPVWGWKDSRTALTWPFWSNFLRGLGYTQIKPIVVVRHPDACASSLIKWGHIRGPAAAAGLREEAYAHSLWGTLYRVIAASGLDQSETLVICLKDLLDPQKAPFEILRLGAHIGASGEACKAAFDWLELAEPEREPVSTDPLLAALYGGLCGFADKQRAAFSATNPDASCLVGIEISQKTVVNNTPYCIYQVSPSGYPPARAFDEVALGLHYGMEALGVNAPLVKHVKDIQGTPIVVGANLFGTFLDTLEIVDALPGDTILFNLEQIDANSEWMTDHYLRLLKRFRVWDYSLCNAQRLESMGISVEGICGIGYVPELARIDQAVEEDIDVLFYGGVNERRQAVLSALRARGLNVVVAANCFGEARDQLVARSKVVLNIHYFDAKVLEMVRISYLLSNEKCVVSETGVDVQEEAVFKDAIAFVPYDGLVERCVELVQDETQRKCIAAEGKSLFSSMRQSDFLAERLK